MDRQLSDNAPYENSTSNRSGWWRHCLGKDPGHHQGGGVPMGRMDSSTTRMAASRTKTGVVSMKRIQKWLSARASMNQSLSMAIVCSNSSDAFVSMNMVLFYLLDKNFHQSEVLAHWSEMTYNERCIAMEIAF